MKLKKHTFSMKIQAVVQVTVLSDNTNEAMALARTRMREKYPTEDIQVLTLDAVSES